MCRFASGFLKPIESLPLAVADLNSHSETAEILKLLDDIQPNGWREFHYLPSGDISVTVLDTVDDLAAKQCENALKARFPTFTDFFNWAQSQKTFVLPQDINCDGITTAKGLKLSEGLERVSLNSLTSAKGLNLPKSLKWISLNGLTSARGLQLPESLEWVSLNGLTSAEALKLPQGLKWIFLYNLTSAEGLELPQGLLWVSLNKLASIEGLKLPKGLKWCVLKNSISAIDIKTLHDNGLKLME